jgi:hypothetical protein
MGRNQKPVTGTIGYQNGHHETKELRPKTAKELRRQLGDIAGQWRHNHDEKLVHQYHSVMAELFALGWTGYLDMDDELPDDRMPDYYLDRTIAPPQLANNAVSQKRQKAAIVKKNPTVARKISASVRPRLKLSD